MVVLGSNAWVRDASDGNASNAARLTGGRSSWCVVFGVAT